MTIKNISGKMLSVGRTVVLPGETCDVELDDKKKEYAVQRGIIEIVENAIEDLNSLKKKELIELCERYSISSEGKKASELRSLLKEVIKNESI